MTDVRPLLLVLRRVTRRLRLQRALESTGTMLVLTGAWLFAVALLFKLQRLPSVPLWLIVLVPALFFPLLGVVTALLRPLRPMVAAQILDRRLQCHDRFGTAYELGVSHRPRPGPYGRAQVEEATQRAHELDVSRTIPLRLPRRLVVFGLQLGAVGLLLLVPTRPVPQAASFVPPPPQAKGMAVDGDELRGVNDLLRDLHQEALDEDLEDVAEAAEAFNRLLQDLADERLPYREALERIAELERQLAHKHWVHDPATERYLDEVGRDLGQAKLTEKAGEALRKLELRDARNALKQAAVQTKQQPPDPQRLKELRQALEKAALRQPPAPSEANQGLEQQRRLKRKNRDQTPDADNASGRLKRPQRELERLQRDVDQQRQRQRQLERLQRDMQQLAESLNLQAGNELEQLLEELGEDINRMAQDQSTEQSMEQLRQRLEELRRLLQQLNRGGKSFQKRLEQFNRQAQGRRPGGSDQDQGGAKILSLAPGGGTSGPQLLVPRPGGGSQQGQGTDQPQGSPGQGIGTSHDPRVQGDPTRLKGAYTDLEVRGAQGSGPSKSEVIQAAADQGFSSNHYRAVQQTYQRHAESLLEKQEIPTGYRQYIRQYFERIRPR